VATNRQVKSALLAKLGVTPQRLSQLAQKRKGELPMTTEQAVYTIAHENGVDLSRHLSRDETDEVRRLVTELRSLHRGPAVVSGGKNGATLSKTTPKTVVVTIAGLNVERLPGMTGTHAKEAKVMAEKVYPALYVFENSARDLITRVLKAAIGDDWWDKIVPEKVREKAEGRKADERKDPWHGKRGAALIDYLDLSDLPRIVMAPKAWPHFRPFFERPSWFQELVNELNVSRRVAAHMNPLEADDVKNVEAAFRKWAKVLKAKADLIP
jgi:hypothetical protein